MKKILALIVGAVVAMPVFAGDNSWMAVNLDKNLQINGTIINRSESPITINGIPGVRKVHPGKVVDYHLKAEEGKQITVSSNDGNCYYVFRSLEEDNMTNTVRAVLSSYITSGSISSNCGIDWYGTMVIQFVK